MAVIDRCWGDSRRVDSNATYPVRVPCSGGARSIPGGDSGRRLRGPTTYGCIAPMYTVLGARAENHLRDGDVHRTAPRLAGSGIPAHGQPNRRTTARIMPTIVQPRTTASRTRPRAPHAGGPLPATPSHSKCGISRPLCAFLPRRRTPLCASREAAPPSVGGGNANGRLVVPGPAWLEWLVAALVIRGRVEMKRLKARIGVAGLVVGLAGAGILWAVARVDAQSTDGTPAPTPGYYVEGARPVEGAADFVDNAEGGVPDGCVLWSRDRPDVVVCGEVAPGWMPPAPPGDRTAYPEVCTTAAEVVAGNAEDLVLRYELGAVPKVEPSTCGAAAIGSSADGTWLVTFKLANPDDVGGYRVAKVWNLTLTPTTQQTPSITLSTEVGG